MGAVKAMTVFREINNAMNPKNLFPTDHKKGEFLADRWKKGYLIYSETIELIVRIAQDRKEVEMEYLKSLKQN